jgi:hypothetical protein
MVHGGRADNSIGGRDLILLYVGSYLVPIAQGGTSDVVYPMTCEKSGTIKVPTLVARGG